MSAAAVLSRQNTGWPSPTTPQNSRVAISDIKMKASPYVSSFWVTSIPPRSRRKSNSAQQDLQKSVDYLTKLPIEIRIMILSYLSPTDLCRFAKILCILIGLSFRCQQVNSSWYHVITQDSYLMKKCQRHLKRQKIHYIKNQVSGRQSGSVKLSCTLGKLSSHFTHCNKKLSWSKSF